MIDISNGKQRRPRRVVFTVVSANYIAFAATLMQSVRIQHTHVDRYIILVDAIHEFGNMDVAANVVQCEACGIPELESMKILYDVMELNTAVKPFCILHFFRAGYDEVIYLDPDILVLRSLERIWEVLRSHSCVLTPHITKPLQDGFLPDDHAILKAGIFNLGFVAMRAEERTLQFVDWWSARLVRDCRAQVELNLFTDQRWMDFAPAFLDDLYVLRDPGYNLAYWNLAHRTVTRPGPSNWLANGLPLVFVHFSGLNPTNPLVLSKHQNRFNVNDLSSDMQDLLECYRKTVLENDFLAWRHTVYAFDYFPNGRRIDRPMRRWLRDAVDEGRLAPEDCVELPPEYFDKQEDGIDGEVRVTRTMYQIWKDRPDLRRAFDLRGGHGAQAYINWFLSGGAVESEISLESLQAGRRLARRVPRLTSTPWPRSAGEAWTGKSAAVGAYLGQTVSFILEEEKFSLPRTVLEAWHARPDLQEAFPMTNASHVDGLLGWGLTSGAVERAVYWPSVDEEIIGRLTALASVSDANRDVPVTYAMNLTRNTLFGRTVIEAGFPEARQARLAQGFWFAFAAPQMFGWPAALTAPVSDWFAVRAFREDVELVVSGYTFSRGLMVVRSLRPDVASEFGLATEPERARFLQWFLSRGLDELRIDIRSFDQELAEFMQSDISELPGVNWYVAFLYQFIRHDLHNVYNIYEPSGIEGLKMWGNTSLRDESGGTRLGEFLTSFLDPVVDISVSVALVGSWSKTSGLGENIRSISRALVSCGFRDFVIVDPAEVSVYLHDGERVLTYRSVSAMTTIICLNADTAGQDWAQLREMNIRSCFVIGWWFWELEHLPSMWEGSYSFVDEVWASSKFSEQAFLEPGLRPVRLMPIPIEVEPPHDDEGAGPFPLEDDCTNFLFVFDPKSYMRRKNPDGVIRAFTLAFPNGSARARLILKFHSGDEFPEQIAELRAMTSDQRIHFIDEVWSRPQIISLISRADCFVSLHRSEGFGRGPAEAMLLGKPVIITDYSGTREFANEHTALLVPFDLIDVDKSEYVGVEHQQWADPNVAAAAERMHWVFSNREKAAEIGMIAQSNILRHYNPITVGGHILAGLKLQSDD